MKKTILGLPLVLWALLLATAVAAVFICAKNYDTQRSKLAQAQEQLRQVQALAISSGAQTTSAQELSEYWKNATFSSPSTLTLADPRALQKMRDFAVAPTSWSYDGTTLILEYSLAP